MLPSAHTLLPCQWHTSCGTPLPACSSTSGIVICPRPRLISPSLVLPLARLPEAQLPPLALTLSCTSISCLKAIAGASCL
mmetsp:Transcript_11513/g.23221  ORF Transcript_11513/g.23221 Transcript_11513/m.23221 type:complete len:80 (-) Transcript_11513:827-1066(-)